MNRHGMAFRMLPPAVRSTSDRTRPPYGRWGGAAFPTRGTVAALASNRLGDGLADTHYGWWLAVEPGVELPSAVRPAVRLELTAVKFPAVRPTASIRADGWGMSPAACQATGTDLTAVKSAAVWLRGHPSPNAGVAIFAARWLRAQRVNGGDVR